MEDSISDIYPDSLEVNEEQFYINDVHFLDVRIEKIGRKWTTSIYDKREWAPLNRVQNNKFPDIDSFLSISAKYGILTSQFHRFSRICTRRKDFVFRARKLIRHLKNKGYQQRVLFARALSFWRKYHFRYDIRNVNAFVRLLF